MCEGPASPGRSARREESSRRSRPTVEMSHALPSKHSLLSGSSQNGPRRPEAGGGGTRAGVPATEPRGSGPGVRRSFTWTRGARRSIRLIWHGYFHRPSATPIGPSDSSRDQWLPTRRRRGRPGRLARHAAEHHPREGLFCASRRGVLLAFGMFQDKCRTECPGEAVGVVPSCWQP